MKQRSRRHLRSGLLVIVVLAVAWILWISFFRSVEKITTVPIARGNIEVNVTALGTLQPHSYVDVGAQASGAIRRLYVQAGDTVHRGQLLVEIDPSVQQAQVDADRATLDSLRAQLAGALAQRDLAETQYRRQQTMNASGATRQEDLETARAALRAARASADNVRAQIVGAQSTLRGADAQLGYTRIYAPMDGTVVSLDAREGQTLNATYQTPTILRIADLSTMTVWTQVSEADILHVQPRMPVYFTTLGAPDRQWASEVRQILPAPPNRSAAASNGQGTASSSNAAQGKVVLYTVLFDVANRDRQLMPQMSAQVFFVEARAKDVVVAPLSAITPVDGQPDHYLAKVREDGKVVSRDVRIGVHDRLSAEVLSGLRPGDRLVTSIDHTRASAGRFEW
ncbi:efflux RND transporter periplasmic adaptor subunit [Robbsia sp. KACC 23696]|uniref:efflux RND transporter periplasmic adaptor subunit n=1 Tax=Robbsia sp. KACC 23696 TaxID=3149231 RepID=UPI00325AE9A1